MPLGMYSQASKMPGPFPSYDSLSGAIVGLVAGLVRPSASCPDCVCREVHCGSFSCGEQSGLVPGALSHSACGAGGFAGLVVALVVASFAAGALLEAFIGCGWLLGWLAGLCGRRAPAVPHGRGAIALGRSSWSPSGGN